ncbi:hypothetical protein BY996DRAFT_6423440 [Phakopsora pachyrhizi]|nr:hypothetical protein BY996DRAFT_6423440 [Phakopsora pachyrhizi]
MDGDETMEVEIGLDTPGTVDRRSASPQIWVLLNQSEEEIITKGQPPKKRLRRQLVDLVTELDPADHPSSSLAPNNPSHHELLPKLLEVDGQNWLMAAPIGVCKELQDLFRFPTDGKPTSVTSGSKKRAREDYDQIEEEEVKGQRGDFKAGYL